MQVAIRPLEENDAKTSYLWRSDPEIWKYTGSKPNMVVTQQIEKEWIKEVLARKNEIRFAICVGVDKEYIGNIQLTNITTDNAEFHIFIGKKEYHNKGIGTQATNLLLEYARKDLKLKEVYLFVNKSNIAAIKAYNKCGFFETDTTEDKLRLIKNLNEINP